MPGRTAKERISGRSNARPANSRGRPSVWRGRASDMPHDAARRMSLPGDGNVGRNVWRSGVRNTPGFAAWWRIREEKPRGRFVCRKFLQNKSQHPQDVGPGVVSLWPPRRERARVRRQLAASGRSTGGFRLLWPGSWRHCPVKCAGSCSATGGLCRRGCGPFR